MINTLVEFLATDAAKEWRRNVPGYRTAALGLCMIAFFAYFTIGAVVISFLRSM